MKARGRLEWPEESRELRSAARSESFHSHPGCDRRWSPDGESFVGDFEPVERFAAGKTEADSGEMVAAAQLGSFEGRTPEVAEPEALVVEPAVVEDELFLAADEQALSV